MVRPGVSSQVALRNLEVQLRELDARLRPIAERPVDITNPDWLKKLALNHDPLGEAGIRPQAQAALRRAIRLYHGSSAEDRQRLRELFQKYHAFAWAATLPGEPTTEDGFRDHLLQYSLVDQGRDSRDAILSLRHLCAEAKKAGVDIRPILNEVAALSSDDDKYGMGSTQKQLIDAAERMTSAGLH